MEKNIPFSITRNIKHHFGFLFGKGYKIRDAIYSHEYFGNWMIVFESPDCIIKIYNDRNCLDLTFSPVGVIDNYQISLGPMIFYLSQGQNFISWWEGEGNGFQRTMKQLKRLARLLEEHIDQITPYFGSDFYSHKSGLIFAQNKYNDLALRTIPRN